MAEYRPIGADVPTACGQRFESSMHERWNRPFAEGSLNGSVLFLINERPLPCQYFSKRKLSSSRSYASRSECNAIVRLPKKRKSRRHIG